MKRLFIGLMPGFAVQRQLSDHQSRWIWPTRARVTPPEKLHLTLHFLGQVEESTEAALIEALSAIRHDTFTLALAAHGSFRSGGVAWIAPAPSPSLASLHKATRDAVASVGLHTSEDWTPHVTLARHAGNVAFPQTSEPVFWHVDRYALVWSTEGKYVELMSWRLVDTGDDAGF
jgi:2'-5' RNA ligase